MGRSPGLERLLLRATSAFVDLEDGLFPAPEPAGAGERLHRMIARLPRDRQRLLMLGGFVLDTWSVLRFGRRFERLDDHRARRILRTFSRSPLKPLRRLYFVLKLMTQFAYFAGEATWEVIGYDGPWLGRVSVTTLPPPKLKAEKGA